MDPGVRAEPDDAAQDGGAGKMALPQEVNDRLVQGSAPEFVPLANVDAHQRALACQPVHAPASPLPKG